MKSLEQLLQEKAVTLRADYPDFTAYGKVITLKNTQEVFAEFLRQNPPMTYEWGEVYWKRLLGELRGEKELKQ